MRQKGESLLSIAVKDKSRILNHQFISVFSIEVHETSQIKSPRIFDMDDTVKPLYSGHPI